MIKLKEETIVNCVRSFLENKPNGNWHKDKTRQCELHRHGADLIMIGGKRNSEYFIIECKGKSSAKSCNSINKEGWLNALGQLVTRIKVSRLDKNSSINRAYKYGLGLPELGAKTALKRIPKNVAKILNLYIFSVDDNCSVTQYSPKDFQ